MWLTLKDLLYRNSHRYPDKLGISNDTVKYTFKEFTERCNKLANLLLSQGLKKGDRVAFLDKTCPWYLEFYYGIAIGGMVGVPINYRLSPREIKYVINDSRPRAIIVGKEYIDLINSIRSQLSSVEYFIAMEPAEGFDYYENVLMSSSDNDPGIVISSEDLAVICYTSGTTAMPKGAMLTHRSINASAVNFNLALSLVFDDIIYYPAPLFHVMGCMAMGMMAMGCTMTFDNYSIPTICETIEREKPTVVVSAAGAWTMLVNSDINFSQYNLSSVKTILSGAGPMRKGIGEKLFNIFSRLDKLYFSFSQTEASPCITAGIVTTRSNLSKGKYNEDSGKETFCVKTKIVDENDNEVPVGHSGEIVVWGPNVMNGYWNMPEETAKTIRNGWLYTGDIGYFDAKGCLFVVDRKKDMIISGGENVASVEVESVLCQHPNIKEAAVIGIPDEKWGERVHAIIVSDKTITIEELITFCRGKLAGYKIPRSVENISELPRTPSGKVLKTELRKKYRSS